MMNILTTDLSGWVSIDSVPVLGATAVAKNTDRIAVFVSTSGDKMTFADQTEMSSLARKLAEGTELIMNHVGHRIGISHNGQKVLISWERSKITNLLAFNTKELLTQLDPQIAIEFLSR